MNVKWRDQDYPSSNPLGILGWMRISVKVVLLICVLILGVGTSLLLRIVEKLFFGTRRPWSPYITQWVCTCALWILGIKRKVTGIPMQADGAVVANHASWLDIFALNSATRVYFVSKSEVENWPGIGFLARLTGTLFIRRDPKEARVQNKVFQSRLLSGHKLLFFPEGTSTDNMRVLPFKPTLFQAFFADELKERLYIQPVTMIYHAPKGADPRVYGWWGDMDFGRHLLSVLAIAKCGEVKIHLHPPVKASDFPNRKLLATYVESTIRSAMPLERQISE